MPCSRGIIAGTKAGIKISTKEHMHDVIFKRNVWLMVLQEKGES